MDLYIQLLILIKEGETWKNLIQTFIYLILFVIYVLMFIFWLLMLVDAIRRKNYSKNEKIIWILIICIFGLLGAPIYYFAVYRKLGKAKRLTIEGNKPIVKTKITEWGLIKQNWKWILLVFLILFSLMIIGTVIRSLLKY